MMKKENIPNLLYSTKELSRLDKCINMLLKDNMYAGTSTVYVNKDNGEASLGSNFYTNLERTMATVDYIDSLKNCNKEFRIITLESIFVNRLIHDIDVCINNFINILNNEFKERYLYIAPSVTAESVIKKYKLENILKPAFVTNEFNINAIYDLSILILSHLYNESGIGRGISTNANIENVFIDKANLFIYDMIIAISSLRGSMYSSYIPNLPHNFVEPCIYDTKYTFSDIEHYELPVLKPAISFLE